MQRVVNEPCSSHVNSGRVREPQRERVRKGDPSVPRTLVEMRRHSVEKRKGMVGKREALEEGVCCHVKRSFSSWE